MSATGAGVIRDFVFGATRPFRAARLILTHPKLGALSFLPILIALLCLVFGIQEARSFLKGWIESWQIGSWGTAVEVLSTILLWILGAVLITPVSGLISLPFNEFLSEASEPLADPPLAPLPRQSIGQSLRLMGLDLVKNIVALTLTGIALLLSLIPAINFLAWVALCFLISFQNLSFPQTRRGIGVSAGFGFLFRNASACFGFGLVMFLWLSIPWIAVFALPCGVVGGTLLHSRFGSGITPLAPTHRLNERI